MKKNSRLIKSQQRYSLRKAKRGVASVFLGTALLFAGAYVAPELGFGSAVVYADEVTTDYAANGEWAPSGDLSEEPGAYPNEKSYETATSDIQTADGKTVTVTAKVETVSDLPKATSAIMASETHVSKDVTADMMVSMPDPASVPALTIIVQPPVEDVANRREGRSEENLNFQGEQEAALLTLDFSEEVTNPIIDLSGVGGFNYRILERGENGQARGSFVDTKFELVTPGATLESASAGRNLTVTSNTIQVTKQNVNNTAKSGIQLGGVDNDLDILYPYDPYSVTPILESAGTGSVRVLGTFKSLEFKLYRRVTPFTTFDANTYKTGPSYFNPTGAVNGYDQNSYVDYSSTETFTVIDNATGKPKTETIYHPGPSETRITADKFNLSVRLANTPAVKRGSVTVEYKTVDGTVLIPTQPVVTDEVVGTDYTAKEAVIEGYTYVGVASDSAPMRGTVSETPQHVVHLYEAISVKRGSLIAEYKTTDGATLKPSVTVFSDEPTGTMYELTPAPVTGYTFVGVSSDSAPAKGTITEGTQRIVFLYEAIPAKRGNVTVEHKTVDGVVLLPRTVVVKDKVIGTDYDISSADIPGYTYVGLSSDSAPATGTVTESSQHVVHLYQAVPKRGSVVVHYVTDSDQKLKDDVTDTDSSVVGTTYDTRDQKPSTIATADGKNYDLVESKTVGQESGQVVEGLTEVTYVYTEVKGDVIVHYVSDTGVTLQADVVDTTNASIGTAYDTRDHKPKTITTADGKTYDLVEAKTIGHEEGQVVRGKTEVTYVYQQKVQTSSINGDSSGVAKKSTEVVKPQAASLKTDKAEAPTESVVSTKSDKAVSTGVTQVAQTKVATLPKTGDSDDFPFFAVAGAMMGLGLAGLRGVKLRDE